MPRGMGRPLAVLVLSDEERSFLEGQVRRHRIARSMADRCRMILRCADGVGNKAVAAELGRPSCRGAGQGAARSGPDTPVRRPGR